MRILLTFILQIYAVKTSYVSSNHGQIMPLNFHEAIHGIYKYQNFHNPQNLSSQNEFLGIIENIFNLNSKLHELIKHPELVNANYKKLPKDNLSMECLIQIEHFIQGLINKKLWTFKCILILFNKFYFIC